MMRKRRNSRRTGLLPVAWAFAGALALSLAQPSGAAAQSACAPYISGGPSNPASGNLLGSHRVTMTVGVSAGLSAGYSISFNVGVYWMEDEGYRRFRCDDYSEWFGFQ